MKILVVTTKSPYPLYEGRALRTYNLLRQLAKHHEIHLLTFVQTEEEVRGIDHLRGVFQYVEAIPLHMGGGRWPILKDALREVWGKAPIHAIKYWTRPMRAAFAGALAREHFDIVHLDMLHLGEYASLCGGLPLVLVEHNVESALMLRRIENTRNPILRAYLRYQYRKLLAYERRVCQSAQVVMTVSDTDARAIEAMTGMANVAVIPNGVDSEYFTPPNTATLENHLIYVGGLTWFPNLDAIRYFCSEVLPLVAQEIPEVSLTVVGKNPGDASIGDIAKNPRVRLVGMVDDIRPWVASASLYVVPLRMGGGTRLKILDALAMGKALVSSSIGCEGLNLVNGEHLLVADGAQPLAAAVVRCLRDEALRRKLGEAGRRLVRQQYDWSVIARDLEAVYAACHSSADSVRPTRRVSG